MGKANLEGDPTVLTAVVDQTEQENSGCTILFAESLSSDTGQGRTGTGGAKSGVDAHREFIVSTIQYYNGTVIKAKGSSVIAEFSDPIVAVQAAVEMQRQTDAYQAASSEPEQTLRIGIYSLREQLPGFELFGSSVSSAASVTKLALTGQILISKDAYQEVSKQPSPHCQWSQAIKIDGHAESQDLFEVAWREAHLNIPSRYEALSQVGKGGMGIVHKVLDRETGEILALKILKPEIAGEPAMQENLKREVLLARKVTHKNVCRIHEFNRSNGSAFISMEFVQGESLQCMLQRVGALSWNAVVPLASQICAGLREAHIQGIVHRDLKPANIMVDTAGSVKIMDFGIARLFQGTGQLTGTMIGTPAYMAPEQLELRRVDARTDIYAVGLLLYEMVTGSQPFVGDTPIAVALKHIREVPVRPREVVPTLPAQAEAVIMKCLQKDPAKRFQSVSELMIAVNRNAGSRPAISQWDRFVADIGGFGRDMQQGLQSGWNAGKEFLGRQDWRALAQRPATKKIAAGLGAASLLAAVIVLSVHVSRKSHLAASAHNSSATPAVPGMISAVQKPNSISSTAIAPAKAGSTNAITSFGVDLSKTSGHAAQKNPPVAQAEAATPPTPHVAPADPKAARTPRNVKAQPAAHHLAVSAPAAQPSVVTPVPDAAATDAATSKTTDEATDSSASGEPPAVFANPYKGAATDTNPSPAASQGLFLEVGSFKDPAWADQAVEKLTQLGFQSFSVHKSHLWIQSYQVRVGPYADQNALEEARKNLVLQGFKPHPVK